MSGRRCEAMAIEVARQSSIRTPAVARTKPGLREILKAPIKGIMDRQFMNEANGYHLNAQPPQRYPPACCHSGGRQCCGSLSKAHTVPTKTSALSVNHLIRASLFAASRLLQ